MTATATTARPLGRPASTPEQLRDQAQHRIADLACAILRALETEPRHGRYQSEKQLRAFLASDGVPFSSGDIAPSLASLQAQGLLERPEVNPGIPRPGWLKSAADTPVELPRRIRLGRLIRNVMGDRLTESDIKERLSHTDMEVGDQELRDCLRRLVDCGQLVMVQRWQTEAIRYVSNGGWEYDETDDLEASIVQVLRDRDELGYSDDEQLKEWLAAANVTYDGDAQLALATGHLFRLGRLQQPRLDRIWESDAADKAPVEVVSWLVEAIPHRG